ncbi:TonB family protein [Chitinibacter bivalviorum]|uniref:TonB family protein n=1 Tax=Chitinibacter bivalviorum TaxID=2739434 RepID=A0A7H9BJ39_9NEIS|nr:energy transducer TonB [Chitinibacter bivalviorum]QLG88660.1 TonB family protein [Chitinibacter bivalviorum]
MNSKLRWLGILALSIVLHVMAVWFGSGLSSGNATPALDLSVVLAPPTANAPVHLAANPRTQDPAKKVMPAQAKPKMPPAPKLADQKLAPNLKQATPVLAHKQVDAEPILSLAQPQPAPLNSISSKASSPSTPSSAKTQAAGDEEAVQSANFRAAYLHNPEIEMPLISRQRGEAGSGIVLVKVSAQGKPLKAQMSKSTGFAALDRAACTTILESWTFEPARRGKVGIESEVEVPVRFQYK